MIATSQLKIINPTKNLNDSAWKDILDHYFPQAIELCFPALYELIDWSKGWVFLDKEFQAITKEGKTGVKYVDKLVRVYLKDGNEYWILILFEIQHAKDNDFPERVFLYTVRGFDKYRHLIVPCVVLADRHRTWHPEHYELRFSDMRLRLDFITCKLIHLEKDRDKLESSMNPFATVILYQLDILKIKGKKNAERYTLKIKRIRDLYNKGFCREDILNLYRFLDYTIALPEELELKCEEEIYQIEEKNHMAYISSIERFGIQRGLQQGRQETRYDIACQLLAEDTNLAVIAKVTKIDIKVLEKMKKEMTESQR